MGYLLVVLLAVLRCFPLSAIRAFGRTLGKLNWWMQTRSTRTTQANIAYCYPNMENAEQVQLSRRSLCPTGCAVFETAHVWRSSARTLNSYVKSVKGVESLLEPLKTKGVVCMLPHLGCWEFAAYFLGKLDCEVTALYDARRLGDIDRVVLNCRSRFGLNMVPVSVDGLRTLLRASRVGKITLILPDQVPTRGQRVIVPFFGRDAHTTTLVSKLIQRSHLAAVVMSVVRVPGGFDVHFDECRDAIYSKDIEQSAAEMNRAIESAIERAPEQYQWEYKRFRRISDIYQ